MVLLHQTLTFLRVSQVKEASLADCRATKARSRAVFFFTLSERAIVEAQLFAVLYCLLSEHSYAVKALVLLDLSYCLTVRIATVREA